MVCRIYLRDAPLCLCLCLCQNSSVSSSLHATLGTYLKRLSDQTRGLSEMCRGHGAARPTDGPSSYVPTRYVGQKGSQLWRPRFLNRVPLTMKFVCWMLYAGPNIGCIPLAAGSTDRNTARHRWRHLRQDAVAEVTLHVHPRMLHLSRRHGRDTRLQEMWSVGSFSST